MKTIQIPQESDPGKTIARIADTFHINADALLTGLLYSLLTAAPSSTPTPSTPAPSAPAEGDAEKGINFLLSLNPQQ